MRPAARLSSVDLPAPEGPTMATISADGRSKLTPRSTSSMRPSAVGKRFETSMKEMAGVPAGGGGGRTGGGGADAYGRLGGVQARHVHHLDRRRRPRARTLLYISGGADA